MEQQGVGQASGRSALPRAIALSGIAGASAADGCAGPAVLLHADWRRDLRQTIVGRVLPRVAHGQEHRPYRSSAPLDAVAEETVARFADSALTASLSDLLAAVETIRAGGLPLESVFLDLLSPAARRLGDLWLADRLSFFDVTVGLGRLQAVVRALGPNFERRAEPARERRILLAPVAGEQHVFGLSIVAAFFRRAGWSVAFDPAGARADVIEQVRVGRFDAVGFTAGGDAAAAGLPAAIAAVRRAAGSGGISILAGGPAFATDPDLARRCGADAVARDATEAVQIAETLGRRAEAA